MVAQGGSDKEWRIVWITLVLIIIGLCFLVGWGLIELIEIVGSGE